MSRRNLQRGRRGRRGRLREPQDRGRSRRRLEYADEHRESGATCLRGACRTVEEIAAQNELRPRVISQHEFEEAWVRARAAQEE
ncbi:DUF6881 domain-containing protein [Actinomadura bangladeshensis]|uniref:DUF6881 domain-containing protein n=1 Tax=Actinomadura bangladeshensis TaxID=453573 RepID=UPI003C7DE033